MPAIREKKSKKEWKLTKLISIRWVPTFHFFYKDKKNTQNTYIYASRFSGLHSFFEIKYVRVRYYTHFTSRILRRPSNLKIEINGRSIHHLSHFSQRDEYRILLFFFRKEELQKSLKWNIKVNIETASKKKGGSKRMKTWLADIRYPTICLHFLKKINQHPTERDFWNFSRLVQIFLMIE